MIITTRAPGRICLFGEHQDYLGFPVIAAAINPAITIRGSSGGPPVARLDLPDLGSREAFALPPTEYLGPRDYLRSCARVLARRGLLGTGGVRAEVRGNIPIQAGTSSSSALVVAWTAFLLAAGNEKGRRLLKQPEQVADLAFAAEVTEFNESGGPMDHYASACGGIVFLETAPRIEWTPLPAVLGEFVLGDSRQPKNTLRTLERLNRGQTEGLRQLLAATGLPQARDLTPEHLETRLSMVDAGVRDYAAAAVTNHWITRRARGLLTEPNPRESLLAELMNRLQALLRDRLRLSTPRLDAMIAASLKAGARAAKINGSGEGGCMFAWCPGHEEAVCEAIRRAGGVPMPIRIGPGLQWRREAS